jgi:hypothetical protein
MLRVVEHGEINEGRAVRERGRGLARSFEREARLAAPACACQDQQAHIFATQELFYLAKLALAAE